MIKRFRSLLIVFFSIYFLLKAFEPVILELTNPTQEFTYSETIQFVNENRVKKIKIFTNDTYAEISLKGDKNRYTTNIPNETVFCEFIQESINKGNDLDIVRTKKTIWKNIVLFVLAIILISKATGTSFKMKVQLPTSMPQIENYEDNYTCNISQESVKFSDVAGLKEEKEELIEVIEFFKNSEKYTEMGAKIPKGVLLSGEPGTGKTLLAKAVAGESGVSFIAVSGSEFDEKYVGVGASRIRNVFNAAKENAPCILFIDEIDAIGQKRTSSEDRWSSQTINQLLTEMDGFDSNSNIIVFAATNRPDILDPALVRPGRFDRNIVINLPDVYGREAIIKVHGKNKKFMDDVTFENIARKTSYFSGAELANLLNEAAIIAVRKNEIAISNSSIDEALKKIRFGIMKKGRKVSEEDKKLVAYHEAGHAVVSRFLATQNNVKEISIISRGNAGGYTWHETVEDKSYISKTELEERLITLLGGRVAEKIALNDISTGASNDLKVATEIARKMICVYGMNQDVGPISLVDAKNEVIGTETMSLITKLMTQSVKNAESKALEILTNNKLFLDMVAETLLEKETISDNELEQIFKTYQKLCN